MALKRIKKELSDIEKANEKYFEVFLADGNLFEWTIKVDGPPNTPYEGGIFLLEVILPRDYPFKTPQFRFKTPVYHTQIHQLHRFCCFNCQDDWSPALTIQKLMIRLTDLLTDPGST